MDHTAAAKYLASVPIEELGTIEFDTKLDNHPFFLSPSLDLNTLNLKRD